MKDFKIEEKEKGGICSCLGKKKKAEGDEKKKEKIFWDKFVISADSKFIRAFNVFIIALNIISSYIYVFFTAFRQRLDDEGFYIQFHIMIGIESIFLLDMILKFFKEFTPSNTTKRTSDFASIVSHYILNGFIIDAIPLIPL